MTLKLKAFNCLDPWNPENLYSNYFGVAFEYESEKWEWVDNPRIADFIFAIHEPVSTNRAKSLSQGKIPIVILDIWHDDNHMGWPEFVDYQIKNLNLENEKVIWVHHRLLLEDSPKSISNNLIWNRHLLYHLEFSKINDPSGKIWTYGCTSEYYQLSEIKKENDAKIFLSPTRIYDVENNIRMKYRQTLFNLLKNQDGFLTDNEGKIWFEPEGGLTESSKEWLEKSGIWFPLANKYYENSYVSIYVETITSSNSLSFHPSEKTYDPLIKGNFILPFSSFKFIHHLEKYFNFKIPDWIDYSYDDIEDPNDRFENFLSSVKKVLQIDKIKLGQLYQKDKWKLDHNRNIFNELRYDSLFEKLSKLV